MQQTKLDRWLRKQFVFVCHIYCNQLPEGLSGALQFEEAPAESGSRYRYKLTTTSEHLANVTADTFRRQNITFTSRVSERGGLGYKLFGDKKKSFTFRMIWVFIAMLSGLIMFLRVPQRLFFMIMGEPAE